MSRTKIVLSCLVLLTALSLTPLCAEPVSSPQPALAVQAPQAGCGMGLALPALSSSKTAKGEICQAAAPKDRVPEFMSTALALRTCLCSCGVVSCSKNSDCGPGGWCTTGVTCC